MIGYLGVKAVAHCEFLPFAFVHAVGQGLAKAHLETPQKVWIVLNVFWNFSRFCQFLLPQRYVHILKRLR